MPRKSIDDVLQPIAIVSTAEEAYRRLKQAIVDGDLAPGERLVERVLAQNMKVSRTPVREALQRLTSEELVMADGSRGLIVARLSADSVEHAYVLREVVEGLAARLACAQPHPELLKQLARSLAVMEDERRDPDVLDAAHSQFHDTIADMSGNPYLILTLRNLQQFRTRMVSLDWITAQRVNASVPEHRLIYEAIESRNPSLAEERARAHVVATRVGLLRRLRGAETLDGGQ